MIIDNHVHIIEEDRHAFLLRAEEGDIFRQLYDSTPFPVEELLSRMDAAGVAAAVVVQPFSVYSYDNRYCADSAARFPDRLAAVCIVDPLAADAPDQLSYWVQERGVQGLRLQAGPRAPLGDPRTIPLWRRVRELGIPMCVMTLEDRLSALHAVATQYPDVMVCLDHLGSWSSEPRLPLIATQQLLDLAGLPNVVLKFSSGNLAPALAMGQSGLDLLRRIVDRFGPDRMMWGSNSPVSRDGTYADMVGLVERALPSLTDAEREQMRSGTALRFWPRLASAAPAAAPR